MQQRNPNSPNRLKRMSARQRKKQRVGEFTDLGFAVQLSLVDGLDIAGEDRFLDHWLEELDRHALSFGGSFNAGTPSQMLGMVFAPQRGCVSPEQRTLLIGWLQARAEVACLEAGELSDAWHH